LIIIFDTILWIVGLGSCDIPTKRGGELVDQPQLRERDTYIKGRSQLIEAERRVESTIGEEVGTQTLLLELLAKHLLNVLAVGHKAPHAEAQQEIGSRAPVARSKGTIRAEHKAQSTETEIRCEKEEEEKLVQSRVRDAYRAAATTDSRVFSGGPLKVCRSK